MQVVDLPTAKLFRRVDARRIVEAAIEPLMKSIGAVGMINPIQVRMASPETWQIVAGAHRQAAALRLGWETVPCVVMDADDLKAELTMIDENFMRTPVSAAEEAIQMNRRKTLYEALYPETKNGGDRKSDQFAKSANWSAGDANRFTKDAAEKTGKSERVVQLAVERGKKISDQALALVTGTKLDTRTYLDELKKVDPEEQAAKVEADLRRPSRKPIAPAEPLRNDIELLNAGHRALNRAWEKYPESRELFMRDAGLVYADQPIMDRRFA